MIFKDIDEIGAECARLRTEEKNIQHYFIMAKKPPCECIVIESKKLYELLSNASVAIDAEQVRHGHWVKIDLRPRNLFYYCNLCRSNAQAITKYCPNCGAKMSEEEADRDSAADISPDCDDEGSWAKFADFCAKEEKSRKKRATVHVYKCHRRKQS